MCCVNPYLLKVVAACTDVLCEPLLTKSSGSVYWCAVQTVVLWPRPLTWVPCLTCLPSAYSGMTCMFIILLNARYSLWLAIQSFLFLVPFLSAIILSAAWSSTHLVVYALYALGCVRALRAWLCTHFMHLVVYALYALYALGCVRTLRAWLCTHFTYVTHLVVCVCWSTSSVQDRNELAAKGAGAWMLLPFIVSDFLIFPLPPLHQ
jgi:hypothetical protein